MFKSFCYFITVIWVCSLSAFAEAKDTSPGQASKITENTPEYTPENVAIFDEENKKHFLEEYEGKTILLVFWATWCAPCITEMADLDILQKDFRKTNFLVLPISEDYTGIEAVKTFYKAHDLRHLRIMHDYKNALFKSFSIAGLPTSILINAEGMAVARFTGSINWYDEGVREILLKHISGNPAVPRNSYQDSALNNIPTPGSKEDKNIEVKQEETPQPQSKEKEDKNGK